MREELQANQFIKLRVSCIPIPTRVTVLGRGHASWVRTSTATPASTTTTSTTAIRIAHRSTRPGVAWTTAAMCAFSVVFWRRSWRERAARNSKSVFAGLHHHLFKLVRQAAEPVVVFRRTRRAVPAVAWVHRWARVVALASQHYILRWRLLHPLPTKVGVKAQSASIAEAHTDARHCVHVQGGLSSFSGQGSGCAVSWAAPGLRLHPFGRLFAPCEPVAYALCCVVVSG